MCQINEIIKNFNSISIPDYLLYESKIINFDLILYWIKYRKNKLVPEGLKYSGWQTDKDNDGHVALMFWIAYRQNEPIRDGSLKPRSGIPDELKYPGWQTDKDNCDITPLMSWIQFRKNEPIPEELKYPGWKTDANCMWQYSIIVVMA